MNSCWHLDPDERPDFAMLISTLTVIGTEMGDMVALGKNKDVAPAPLQSAGSYANLAVENNQVDQPSSAGDHDRRAPQWHSSHFRTPQTIVRAASYANIHLQGLLSPGKAARARAIGPSLLGLARASTTENPYTEADGTELHAVAADDGVIPPRKLVAAGTSGGDDSMASVSHISVVVPEDEILAVACADACGYVNSTDI
eukprot:Opistho-2@13141